MKKIPLPSRFLPVLLLCAGALTARAQTRTLSGTVTTERRPLAGVSVSQEGRSTTAVTNSQGYWQLTTEGDHPVLLFRHPDYAEERTEAGTQTILNTQLTRRERVSEIEEVVVNAGYYKVKDRERTGSIARVTAKDIENQPVTNVLSAVQGRMAGVSITQSSGVPGGGFDVQIRGRNSLRTLTNSNMEGNMPLYVLDGVILGAEVPSVHSTTILPLRRIHPLNGINPDDIESIEILKDADATAIYGSRGANGVILITTKKGKAGELRAELSTQLSLSRKVPGMKMLNTQQYLEMRRQAYANDGISNFPSNAYDINGKWDQNRETDWQKELTGHTAQGSNTQLGISGGSTDTRFSLSLGHQQQETVFGRDFIYKMNTLTHTLSHRTPERNFSLSMTGLLSNAKNNLVNEDMTTRSLILVPSAPNLYQPDGSLNWENNTFTNPAAIFNSTYINDQFQYIQNLNTHYMLLPNIELKMNAGLTYQAFEEWSLRPNTIYNPSVVTGQSSAYSTAAKSNSSRLSLLAEPQISWKLRRGKHTAELLVGATYQRDITSQESIRGSGFESNAFLMNIGAAKTKTVADQFDTEYRYGAAFARVNYQYDGKYIINLTGRRDGSSRFGPNHQYGNFGAVGAAWIFSRETLLSESEVINFGKLRASIGTAGSDNIGDFQYLNTYEVSLLPYNGVTGLIPARLFNPDFSWEKTTKIEAALELSLLHDRLHLSAAWYRNRSSNQLVGYQLPGITGFSSVLANLPATVENRGVELEATARLIHRRNLKWHSSVNLSIPRSKVLDFPGLEGSTYANYFVVGEPMNLIKLYQWEGIDPQTGIYKFKDMNGDGKITATDDRQVSEHLGPKLFGGWNNTFQYKRWTFSFLFQFVQQKARNYISSMPLPGGMFNQPLEVLDVWSPNQPQGMFMPFSTGANAAASQAHALFRESTAAVSDASFIRLKNVQLAYELPMSSSFIRNFKVYVHGQNLLTITRYFGPDPEFTTSGFVPPLQTVAFGATFTF